MLKTFGEKQLSSEVIHALERLPKKSAKPLLIEIQGQKFVVLREEAYRGWKETAYLLSSTKNAAVLREALNEPLDTCKDVADYQHSSDAVSL